MSLTRERLEEWRHVLAGTVGSQLVTALEAALRVVEHYSADCGDHCKNSCRYCEFRAAYPDLLEGER